MKKVFIMAGGTGGHIFPGLAIANALLKEGITVCWLGSINGMETRLVPETAIKLYTLAIKGARGKTWQQQLRISFYAAYAIYQAIKILRLERPDLVLGMGGFATGPGGIAAKILGIPLVIHEQNSIAGLTNRWLAKLATRVLCAFPDAFSASVTAVVTGNPVRADIAALPSPDQRYQSADPKVRLLILGGSRGAQILNEVIPQTVALLADSLPLEIWHQTGEAGFAATQLNYQNLAISAKVSPFITNIADSYAWADVVICRAGALTLAEIMTVGLAAILIPYPFAADDHQTVNAEYLTKNSAAVLLQQSELSVEKLYEVLKELLTNAEKRLMMANASYRLRQDNAVDKIIAQCFAAAK